MAVSTKNYRSAATFLKSYTNKENIMLITDLNESLNRNRKRAELIAATPCQRHGTSVPLCSPNQFALAEASETLEKETTKGYVEFPNYKINKSI